MRQDFKRSSNSLINEIINDKFGIEIRAFYLIFETLCCCTAWYHAGVRRVAK